MLPSRIWLAISIACIFDVACGSGHAPALPAVLEATVPAATSACPFGGTTVQSGLDTNGNGRLDPGEVSASRDVCGDAPAAPGTPPPRTLSRVEWRDFIAACHGNGIAISSGVDSNDNGVLDDAEVTSTVEQCGSSIEGDVTVTSAAELAALAHVTAISGNLTLQGTLPADVALPNLELIGGTLTVAHTSIRRADFGALITAGVEVRVNHNDLLEQLRFDQLTQCATFALVDNPKLTTILGIPRVIATQLVVSGAGALTSLRLEGLRADGLVSISGNPLLARLEFVSSTVNGTLHIEGNAQLATLDLSGFYGSSKTSSLAALELVGNPTLAALTTPYLPQLLLDGNAALARVVTWNSDPTVDWLYVGQAQVRHNGALAKLRFWPQGQGTSEVTDNGGLIDLEVSLSRQAGLDLEHNAALRSLQLWSYSGGDVLIADQPSLQAFQLEGFDCGAITFTNDSALLHEVTVNELVRAKSFHLRSTTALDRVVFTELYEAAEVEIANTELGALVFPDQTHGTSVGTLRLQSSRLAALDCQQLNITEALQVKDDTLLETVRAGAVGSLDLSRNPDLESVVFRSTQLYDLLLQDNPLLASVSGLENVVGVGDILSFANNPRLTRLALPKLEHAHTLSIDHSPMLTQIDLGTLQTVDMLLGISETGIAGPLALPQLTSVNILSIGYNPAVTMLRVPQLPQLANLQVTGNDALTELGLDALTDAKRATFQNNRALSTCKVQALAAQAHLAAANLTNEGNLEESCAP